MVSLGLAKISACPFLHRVRIWRLSIFSVGVCQIGMLMTLGDVFLLV